MIKSSMISEYLEIHDVKKTTSVMRRTRASTKQFIDDYHVELRKIEGKRDFEIAIYSLNGKEHEVKVQQDEILDVSCGDCLGKILIYLHFGTIYD